MKTRLKQLVKSWIRWGIKGMSRTAVGQYIYNQILHASLESTQEVIYQEERLRFATPNPLNLYRAMTFAEKEPETLEWIDTIPQNAILWDIGANIGLYTCYAARSRACRVFAFEPSVFNLELLARNIFYNQLTERVTIVPLPLTQDLTLSTLNMTSTDWGGAMSTFGCEFGHDGKRMERVFAFPTVGLSMVDVVERLKIPPPDYIKMDVDGIEHLILKGGLSVLQNVRSILIEINDRFHEQSEQAALYLQSSGFSLRAKRHAASFDLSEGDAAHTYNQIWTK